MSILHGTDLAPAIYLPAHTCASLFPSSEHVERFLTMESRLATSAKTRPLESAAANAAATGSGSPMPVDSTTMCSNRPCAASAATSCAMGLGFRVPPVQCGNHEVLHKVPTPDERHGAGASTTRRQSAPAPQTPPSPALMRKQHCRKHGQQMRQPRLSSNRPDPADPSTLVFKLSKGSC